jgi:HAMP domain-containing protein
VSGLSDRRLVARVLAAGAALVVCAWFALGIRQSTSLDRAQALIAGQFFASPARATEVEHLLDNAGFLNPDRQVDLDRVQILLERGHAAAARQVARGVVAAEPQNIQAWLALAHAAGPDRAVLDEAIDHIKQLEPLIP